ERDDGFRVDVGVAERRLVLVLLPEEEVVALSVGRQARAGAPVEVLDDLRRAERERHEDALLLVGRAVEVPGEGGREEGDHDALPRVGLALLAAASASGAPSARAAALLALALALGGEERDRDLVLVERGRGVGVDLVGLLGGLLLLLVAVVARLAHD